MVSYADKALLDQIFNLKFTAKSFAREAHKAEKDEKSEKLKVKKAIEKGNIEGARIYAQNAIRKKTEQLNYLRLGSRLDAVVSRLDTQAKMNAVNKAMSGIVKSLEKALSTANLEQVSMNMDAFERQFESLDVQAEFVESAMSNSTAAATPADQVDALMQQVAEEHGLELQSALPTAARKAAAAEAAGPSTVAAPEEDLTRRLAELRGRG